MIEGIVEFVLMMKKTGGIPREEKWQDVIIRTLEENLNRVLPEIVKKEIDYILDNMDTHPENFLVVGGTAINAYVPYRVTTDIDFLTYDENLLSKFLKTYEQYRKPDLGAISIYYFRGKHTDKVRLIVVSRPTYDITWFPEAKVVRWSARHYFYIPQIERLIEMKELSDRAIDKEDALALKYWKKLWNASEDITPTTEVKGKE